jgi:4-hydroxy-tetrahydrodipicolinate synthase
LNRDELVRSLEGVIAIPTTPFREDGPVDHEAYQKGIRRLVEGGVRIITPNGNTGEFYCLTPAEANTALYLALESAEATTLVIVGVGHDVASAVDAAKAGQAAGAPLIMIHQPVHPYVSVEGWIAYNRAIARAVPELGVVLYVRNPAIPGVAFARLGDSCPNIVGVKYAVADPAHFAKVANEAGADRFAWIAGLAELAAPGYFAMGAGGFTSGLANVDPESSLHLWSSLQSGDTTTVRRLWERIRPFEELRAANANADNVSVVKEALCQLGVSNRDVRPPSSELTEEAKAEVTVLLKTWGLLG